MPAVSNRRTLPPSEAVRHPASLNTSRSSRLQPALGAERENDGCVDVVDQLHERQPERIEQHSAAGEGAVRDGIDGRLGKDLRKPSAARLLQCGHHASAKLFTESISLSPRVHAPRAPIHHGPPRRHTELHGLLGEHQHAVAVTYRCPQLDVRESGQLMDALRDAPDDESPLAQRLDRDRRLAFRFRSSVAPDRRRTAASRLHDARRARRARRSTPTRPARRTWLPARDSRCPPHALHVFGDELPAAVGE